MATHPVSNAWYAHTTVLAVTLTATVSLATQPTITEPSTILPKDVFLRLATTKMEPGWQSPALLGAQHARTRFFVLPASLVTI